MNEQEHNIITCEAILTLILESKTLEQLKSRIDVMVPLIKKLPTKDREYLRTMYISRIETIKNEALPQDNGFKKGATGEDQSPSDKNT